MMIHAQIAPDLSGDEPRRRVERVETAADMSLRKLGSTSVDARLINISSHGFMAETDLPMEAGSRVWLTLPRLQRINALVVWSKGCRFGGEFASPIDPLVVLEAVGCEARAG
jgi:hypothetical protein